MYIRLVELHIHYTLSSRLIIFIYLLLNH